MVGKVVRHVADAQLARRHQLPRASIEVDLHELVLVGNEADAGGSENLVESLLLFALGPTHGNGQLVVHREVEHEERKWVNTGQVSSLILPQQDVLQVMVEFVDIFPVAAGHLGVEQFDKRLGVYFANASAFVLRALKILKV